jgi:hypothetical protein
MKNEKGISTKDASNTDLTNQLTMTNLKTNQNKFQYDCSFCLRELPSGGIRFNGIVAGPLHYALARKLVDGLHDHHRANYFNNLRGHK